MCTYWCYLYNTSNNPLPVQYRVCTKQLHTVLSGTLLVRSTKQKQKRAQAKRAGQKSRRAGGEQEERTGEQATCKGYSHRVREERPSREDHHR